ncbi:hypothetical protein FNF27_07385 [Cafeteria roenbergensis]|uniref:MORN repeat-containing protein 3 n=1 Tax=Cafeteria roenbergensis TaxID=33653 RepID=A0A5A8DQZ1_CAFRO|nr:hypothetical protein FNF27_07385 [Cafeteria roenbergensis]
MAATAGATSLSGTEPLWRSRDRAAQKNGPRRTAFSVAPAARKVVNPHRISAAGPDGPISSFKATGSYQGEWRNNERHGFGTLTTSNGSKYEGEWVAGKRHGRGTQWVMRDGELQKQYAGDWFEGRRQGFGVFFFPSGDRYEGEFVEGKRSGQGTMAFADGSVYEGRWVEGKREGVGVFTTADGDAFEGHFKADVKHGPGRLFYRRTRKMYEGEWVDGTPKCGVFSAIPAPGGGPAEADEDDDFVLPELALRDPDSVIMAAVDEARVAAARARGEAGDAGPAAAAVRDEGEAGPVGGEDAWGAASGLSDEELDELWAAFQSAPGGLLDNNCVDPLDLGAIFTALGLSPGEDDVDRILGIARLSDDGLSFEAFADVMARLRE